ncbi:hypothetical protein ZYGR_0Z01700 [Zygosaccharomyces rouxii]|uniref:ZYRO0G04202p n=2 Tax=Zygosaccharomyces rouxii TaxID=4956 RepID=C5DZG4_ZYGRC|nr:uncharacterized protein ZYRO0G04202g [Zygosaccharomyces rouxii]KAH9202247.1 hypothetical protein LQ764DRAFT_5051 [Zygosaccharomyces rouxii]GAV50747.1 hypothetical protein ZYGR_0Z01700 [Zygosaccharomyces rouxii]CAR29248.1 ZYRO0G04202p [Zygosaccharomyces rouxii]
MVNSGGPVSMKQLTVISYLCVYIRFVKDGSLLLALLAWATVNLGEFMGSVMSAYQDSVDSDAEDMEGAGRLSVVKAVMHKGLKYTQAILMLQVIYAVSYHMKMDLEGDFCRRRGAYILLLLVGEQECGRGGRWMLLALDWVILLMQLVLITMELTPDDGRNCHELDQLDTDRYGALAILQFNPYSEPSSMPELPVTRGNHYGSI